MWIKRQTSGNRAGVNYAESVLTRPGRIIRSDAEAVKLISTAEMNGDALGDSAAPISSAPLPAFAFRGYFLMLGQGYWMGDEGTSFSL